ncbi:MAG: AAA family ATPase [Streptosporangiales bacterium]|nr:AAA family ATPase [Streptosporangiales bacterium]
MASVVRRPGFEEHRRFRSKRNNRCAQCDVFLPVETMVLGKPLDGGRWHIVCDPCGTVSGGVRPEDRVGRAATGAARSAPRSTSAGGAAPRPKPSRHWSTLVRYLTACVEWESLPDPVRQRDQHLWTPLDLWIESVLSGNDQLLPASPELTPLFEELGEFEAVYYGWPVVVVTDGGGVPYVAPLFLRQLDEPGGAGVPLASVVPQINTKLLDRRWWRAENREAIEAAIPDAVLDFGKAVALTALAETLAAAFGFPVGGLDPTALLNRTSTGELFRPQVPGIFNLAMACRGLMDAPARNLIKDLNWMAEATDVDRSAARFLFEQPPECTGVAESCAITLNDAQQQALASAATAPLTVITGPPGTGKSQIVAGIVAEAWLREESVLLASTNNAPVDDVIEDKAKAVHPALLLRTGNKEKQTRLRSQLETLLAEGVGEAPSGDPGDLQPPRMELDQLRRELRSYLQGAQRLLDAATARDRARRLVWPDGQSPADIQYTALRRRAERALGTRWRRLAGWRARRCLRSVGLADSAVPIADLTGWAAAEERYQAAAEVKLREVDVERMCADLTAAEAAWQDVSRDVVVGRLVQGYAAGREALQRLVDVLGDDSSNRSAMGEVMRAVKGWATSALSVRGNFDCRAGSIDLVVIDEASQCNLAQVLPLAYRAKRLVVIGDPHQVAPVVTTASAQLHRIAAQHGTTHEALVEVHQTHGEDSAFTAFAARVPGGPYLLDEHYRCHPEIIGFCNEQFYEGRLRVLTEVDVEDRSPRGLEWRDVIGTTAPGPAGQSSVNEAEAAAIVDWIRRAEVPPEAIGVVTPFRAQAGQIGRGLRRAAPDGRFEKVKIGTAHTFQGAARHTMLFSAVLSKEASAGTVGWLEKERNLVNVAVSRAQRHLVVFGDRVELQRLGATTLVALANAADGDGVAPAAEPTPAVAAVAALADRGIAAKVGGSVEGYATTLTIRGPQGTMLDVEVTELAPGHDPVRVVRQLAWRDARVKAMGRPVVRVPGWEAYLEPDAAVDRVAARVRK